MIATELYGGQGLGNQLWAYVVTRLIADHKGCDFGIMSPERFKGKDFMDLDFGRKIEGVSEMPTSSLPESIINYHKETCELFGTDDGSGIDKELFNIPLNTKVDGNFQSYSYIRGKENKVREWLKFKALHRTSEDTCIIHMRCGDYKNIQDVFLPLGYYQEAMEVIRKINPHVNFFVVSDEPSLAYKFLGVPSIGGVGEDKHKAAHHLGGDIGVDFSYLANAKYVIIPNSSFGWWAAFLNTNAEAIVAPKYWCGWKDSEWRTGDIKSDNFLYV